jgi:cell division initiation protein
MNLTPLDVRRKAFDKGFRGYDPTEVDLFLKQVADRLEEVQEEARRAEERSRESEAKLVHYEKVELALQEALESARETAKRAEAAAEERARLMIQEAELRAETILRDAERERHGLRQDLVRLSSRQAEVAARLRGFLLSELEVLAQFQGDDPVGFIKLQAAGASGQLPPAQSRLEAPIDAPDDLDESEVVEGEGEPADLGDAPGPVEQSPAPAEYGSSDEPGPTAPPPFVTPDYPEPPAEAEAPVDETPLNAPLDPDVDDEPAPAEPEAPLSGAYAAAPEHPDEDEQPAAPPPKPAVTGGWDLRSLVTGEERSVAASEEERERIRRILDDLD